MRTYQVVDTGQLHAKSLVCLCDEGGRYHVAQATSPAPVIGMQLSGRPPQRGVRRMTEARSGQVFRLIFELIDCSQDAALQGLHGGARG